jgi:hypothetical protein
LENVYLKDENLFAYITWYDGTAHLLQDSHLISIDKDGNLQDEKAGNAQAYGLNKVFSVPYYTGAAETFKNYELYNGYYICADLDSYEPYSQEVLSETEISRLNIDYGHRIYTGEREMDIGNFFEEIEYVDETLWFTISNKLHVNDPELDVGWWNWTRLYNNVYRKNLNTGVIEFVCSY